MWLFAGFIAIPLIEIALFVTLGGWLGLWLTLAVVIGTAAAGITVIRWQGLRAMEGLRQATQMRRDPLRHIAGNALLVMAGILLILPGFLTDALGLLLLIPQMRRLVVRGLSSQARVFGASADGPRRSGPDVIDGEFFEIEPERIGTPPNDRPASGWRQH